VNENADWGNSRNVTREINKSNITKANVERKSNQKEIKDGSFYISPLNLTKKNIDAYSNSKRNSEKKDLKISFDSSIKNSNIFSTLKENQTKNVGNSFFLNFKSPQKNTSKGKINIASTEINLDNEKEVIRTSFYNEFKSLIRKSEKVPVNLQKGSILNTTIESNSKKYSKKTTNSFINLVGKRNGIYEDSDRPRDRNPNSSYHSKGTKEIRSGKSHLQTSKRNNINEISITLKDITNQSEHVSKNEEGNSKNNVKFEKNSTIKRLNTNSNRSSHEKINKIENIQFKEFLNFSGENIDKPSDSGRVTTKKSEDASDKNSNVFRNKEMLQSKVTKKDIMYTNEINYEDVEENLKNIIFKKKY